MLLTKLWNGLELTWDSLDAQERKVVVYTLCYLAVSAWLAWQQRRREALRREILEELVIRAPGVPA